MSGDLQTTWDCMTDDYVVVPRNPTKWMLTQGHEGFEDGKTAEVWRRMVDAAPEAMTAAEIRRNAEMPQEWKPIDECNKDCMYVLKNNQGERFVGYWVDGIGWMFDIPQNFVPTYFMPLRA